MTTEQIIDQFNLAHPLLVDHIPALLDAVDMLCDAYHRQALLLTCGNGGSAADASHIVGELVKSFRIPRPLNHTEKQAFFDTFSEDGNTLSRHLMHGLRAVSLNSETILLTAMGNDVGFEFAFAQQVMALGKPGDILFALSTFGNSANVIAALQTARVIGMHTVGMTGEKPCKMDQLCDILFHARANTTHHIQEHHIALYHALCLMVENQLFAIN